jgi:hypothetical protein
MAFIDRFIELPIKEVDDLTSKLKDATYYLNPLEIVGFRETYDIRVDGICVNVSTKNGDSFNTYMELVPFVKLLNAHMRLSK